MDTPKGKRIVTRYESIATGCTLVENTMYKSGSIMVLDDFTLIGFSWACECAMDTTTAKNWEEGRLHAYGYLSLNGMSPWDGGREGILDYLSPGVECYVEVAYSGVMGEGRVRNTVMFPEGHGIDLLSSHA